MVVLQYALWILALSAVGAGTSIFYIHQFLMNNQHFGISFVHSVSLSPVEVLSIATKVIGEEFFFRLLPIVIAIRYFGTQVLMMGLIMGASAYLFAVAHSFRLGTLPYVSISLILSLTFLRFGGLQGSYLRALSGSSIVHFNCNMAIVMYAHWVRF